MTYNCNCGKSFKSFEDFAKHHNQTGHMEQETNHKDSVTWFQRFTYWWVELMLSNDFVDKFAFVGFLFIVLAIMVFLAIGVF